MTATKGSSYDDSHRPRARDLGLNLGELHPGPLNAITDVPGVRVGHCTLLEGRGALVPGQGPVRTGVTAIIPHPGNLFRHKVPAAVDVINGFGKPAGLSQIHECGVLETPVLLTNTLNVGLVADALVDYMLRQNPEIGVTTGSVNPVVLECNDGELNDIRGRHVKREHVFAALENASGDAVEEGAVGAGTGMTAFGWKGGIGTSSRQVPVPGRDPYILGALVLSNFGTARDLMVAGWPVGRYLKVPDGQVCEGDGDGGGSVVIVLATDAPLDSRQLRRIAARAVVGIVRCGSRLAHGSGDYVLAFSTATRVPHLMPGGETIDVSAHYPLNSGSTDTGGWTDDSPVMEAMLRAAGEATEESVLNSMLQAHTVVGRDNHVRYAVPVDSLQQLIRRFGDSVESGDEGMNR